VAPSALIATVALAALGDVLRLPTIVGTQRTM
jgi:hypothetical protein